MSKYAIIVLVSFLFDQGCHKVSILGPLLFLIYINDIPNYVMSSSTLMFVDDTKCYKTIAQSSDSTQLQPEINSLCRWSTDSNLNFNHSKIVQLSFKSQIVSSTYTIRSTIIKIVDKHRGLGVILSSNLSWEPHYQHITSKAYKLLELLRQSFSSNISINCKKQLYISLIRSNFIYYLETMPHKACTVDRTRTAPCY